MSSPSGFDSAGWLHGVRRVPSPNCDARPEGAAIELLVVHSITLPPGEFGGEEILRLFTNTLDCSVDERLAGLDALRVSAHFLIRRDGELIQFVPCAMRAWHAGVSSFEGRARCNDFSVGIELEGTDLEPFTERQYDALAHLGTLLVRTYPLIAVAAHSEIAPGRKTDPGPQFDWSRAMAHLPTLRRIE